MSFDIVIPVGPHDTNKINKQIVYTKKNIIGYRNIYIITNLQLSLAVEDCTIIDENVFPFTIKDIEKYHGKSDRNGWYLQQLLKLYASHVIPNILPTYLVIDCDTFFLKQTLFIDTNQKCLYNFSDKENHIPYYDHMRRLNNKFIKIHENSGICHHMMFQNKFIQEIFDITEEEYKKPFWTSFLELVNENYRHNGSGASEYELYFNYVLKYHANEVKIRKLEWNNLNNFNQITPQYDYISIHWYSCNGI